MQTLLQINVIANSGSTGKIAEDIGRMMLRKGWRSVIAYGRWANDSQSELIRIGSDCSIREHFLESRCLDNHGLASREATKSFIRTIKEINPDIIHLHNIHGYYLNYRLLFDFLNETNIPIVWTLHDCWSFTGHCAHFVTAGCEKWKNRCFNCPLISDYPKSLIDRSKRNFELKEKLFSANRNLHLVPVCDWLEELIKQSFLKQKDITVIKNGIDLNVFRPIPSISNEKKLILGVSTVWTQKKGLQDYYRIRSLLDPNRYDIVLVGLTKKQIKELPKGIVGIERTESVEALVKLYSAASVLVNPTYADTFPTVNLEALACGTPVITYKTGGSPESIDNETGCVVEQGDICQLVSAIEKICAKDKSFYSEKCRNKAEKEFDKNERFEDYYTLYKSLLN